MVFETFQEWQDAVDKRIAQVWMQNGGGLSFDPVNPELGVGHVLHDDDALTQEVREARLATFQELMDFVWAEGPNPMAALKRLFAITRCGSPQHLAFMTQSDVAILLNETRAATQSREERVWEKFLEGEGFVGTRGRLKKNDAARATYAQKQKGNHNRQGGVKATKKFSVLRHQAKQKQNDAPNEQP